MGVVCFVVLFDASVQPFYEFLKLRRVKSLREFFRTPLDLAQGTNGTLGILNHCVTPALLTLRLGEYFAAELSAFVQTCP